MGYYHCINSISLKNKIITLSHKKRTSLSFILFEIFQFEIFTTNYASPVIILSIWKVYLGYQEILVFF